jgi:hypothetical protein
VILEIFPFIDACVTTETASCLAYNTALQHGLGIELPREADHGYNKAAQLYHISLMCAFLKSARKGQ